LRPGGVRHGIGAALRQYLLTTLAAFARDTRQVNELMLGSHSVLSRLRGVGGVSHQAAADLGLLGLAARASDVAIDTRASLPGRLHATRPIDMLVEDSGDCYARLHLRMREIDASLSWLTEVLQDDAIDLAAVPLSNLGALQPDSLCVSLREGFRGPVLIALETDAHGQLQHAKVQDPSLFNWFGLALAVRNNEISDFPICNKSFDLSYCGNDL
jgi:Ni,Fe-hydrogenase III large subunit